MNLLFSIFRQEWAIEPGYAQAQLPFIHSLINGKYHSKVDKAPDYAVAGSTTTKNKARIAVIPIEGVITRDGTFCTPGAKLISKWIKNADENPEYSGIVLAINSPGGEARGADVITDAIRSCSKKVVAHISHGMAASAGYWIASQCSEIYVAHKNDEVGSIGAFTTLADSTGEYEAKGWKIKTIYAKQSTDKNGDVRAAFEGDDEPVQERLTKLVETFINEVKAGRGDRIKSDDWQTGKMYRANEAKKLGLIDGIKTLDQTINSFSTIKKPQTMSKNKLTALVTLLAWSGIESTTEGIHLSEEDATKLDEFIAQHEALKTKAENLEAEAQKATDKITDLETQLKAAQDEAASWKTKAEEMGQKPAPDVTQSVPNDPKPETPRKLDPVTAQAQRFAKQWMK